MDWLQLSPSHPNYKSFSISAPPGSGKTSIASGLCTLVKDSYDLRPHAWHLASKGDCTRLNPMSCLRTWAFQLALSIESLQQ